MILGVVNFPSRKIGPFLSETITLGVPDENNNCILITTTKEVPISGKLY